MTHRSNFTCSLAFQAAISEPGFAYWALLLLPPAATASAPPQAAVLPAPADLLAAAAAGANLSVLFPNTTIMASGELPFAAISSSAPASLTLDASAMNLRSQRSYLLVAAARDAAAPAPNVAPVLSQLPLVSPDVTPPAFTGV